MVTMVGPDRQRGETVANVVPADERPAYARLLAVAPAGRSSAPLSCL